MLTKFLQKYFPGSAFTNFWQDKRKRALVLLPLWCIFIILIIVNYVIPYQKNMNNHRDDKENVTQNKEETVNYLNNLENLINSNYNFEITVTDLETAEKITYKGQKMEGLITGSKNIGDEEILFEIEDDIVYTVTGEDSREVYTFLSDLEYDKYLSLKTISDEIKDINPTLDGNQIIYEKEGICVILYIVGDYINAVSVKAESTNYLFAFTNID